MGKSPLRFKDVGPLQEKASRFLGGKSNLVNFEGMEYHRMVQYTPGCCHLRLRDMMSLRRWLSHLFMFSYLCF